MHLFEFGLYSCPLATWWKVRDYFVMPKIRLHFFGSEGLGWTMPYASYRWLGSILTVFVSDLLWKDKYDSPRHERDPYIWVCFFKKFGFNITFKVFAENETFEKRDVGMYYWEYILDYLYYRKRLDKFPLWFYRSKLYKMPEYGDKEDGSDDKDVPMKIPVYTPSFSLTKKGKRELLKILNIN